VKNRLYSKEPSSFRDPSGFVFYYKGEPFRSISLEYREIYDRLINSGLYEKLIDNYLIIPHIETSLNLDKKDAYYKILKPQIVDFISYPYEWCFSQYKDAALTTLKIQKIALDHNMSLKDSSAFNIQFVNGKPVLIDTLSFQIYDEGKPWIAYKQFCQHFLAPLALMNYVDTRLGQMMCHYIDGIPLDITKKMLPFYSNFNLELLLHINLHSSAQRKYTDTKIKRTKVLKVFSKNSFYRLIDSLEKCVTKLTLKTNYKKWENYYTDLQIEQDYRERKMKFVKQYINVVNPKKVWDIGANTGLYSRIAVDKGISTVSFDSDFSCIEKNYLLVKERDEKNHLPLYNDITNPSSAIGWANNERKSLMERGPVDLVLALAVIHHLSISNNLPLARLASFLSSICNWLIIEFVPKSDPMVVKLLNSRKDIFSEYNCEEFESVFSNYFNIQRKNLLEPSFRIIYLLRKK